MVVLSINHDSCVLGGMCDIVLRESKRKVGSLVYINDGQDVLIKEELGHVSDARQDLAHSFLNMVSDVQTTPAHWKYHVDMLEWIV